MPSSPVSGSKATIENVPAAGASTGRNGALFTVHCESIPAHRTGSITLMNFALQGMASFQQGYELWFPGMQLW
jgi:hypothetical protein